MTIRHLERSPDNDNRVHAWAFVTREGEPDMAARRRFVASIKKTDPVLAWPTIERLVHLNDPEKVRALLWWRDMTEEPSVVTSDDDAHDPLSEDLRREIRPSIPELFAASEGERTEVFGEGLRRHTATLGRLVFNYDPARRRESGLLVEWGQTAKGKPLKPVDRTRAPKGNTSPKRGQQDVAAYLARPSAIPSPLHSEGHRRPIVGRRGAGMYDPLPCQVPAGADKVGRYGVERARAELVALGVDGSVPFSSLPFPAKKCDDFVVQGPQWKAGVSAIKGTGGDGFTKAPDRGHSQTESELARLAEIAGLRNLLDHHADILDMAVTDSTAEDIGFAAGYSPSSAKKYGAALIDAALNRLMEIRHVQQRKRAASNDNAEMLLAQAA